MTKLLRMLDFSKNQIVGTISMGPKKLARGNFCYKQNTEKPQACKETSAWPQILVDLVRKMKAKGSMGFDTGSLCKPLHV